MLCAVRELRKRRSTDFYEIFQRERAQNRKQRDAIERRDWMKKKKKKKRESLDATGRKMMSTCTGRISRKGT